MSESPIRHVFFDFGGTLFSYAAFREPFHRLLSEIADELDLEERDPLLLRQRFNEVSEPLVAEYARKRFYLHRDLFGDQAEALLRSFDREAPEGFRNDYYDRQTRMAAEVIKPRADASEVIGALRAAGVHVAIVSNIDNDQFGVLWNRCGLAADSVTTSEEAGACKPDPEIFRFACARAGAQDPAEVLFVGDSVYHDAQGALVHGMKAAVLIPDDGARAGREAVDLPAGAVAIGSLSEVPELVAATAGADRGAGLPH